MKKLKVLKLLVVLFCIATTAITGCSSNNEKVAAFISRGDQLFIAGESDKAILEYKNALQIDPHNSGAKMALGKVFKEKHQAKKAFSYFSEAVETDPDLDEARIELASLYAKARLGDKALEMLKEIKSYENFEPGYSIIKAQAYISDSKFKKAVDVLKIIPGYESNGEALGLLSICRKELGQYNEMKETVNIWRKLAPGVTTSYVFMARFAKEQGDHDQVAKEINSMINVGLDNHDIGLFGAKMLERFGLTAEAEKAYSRLPGVPEMLWAKAGFMLRQGKNDQARAVLEKIVSRNPDDIQGVVLLVGVLASMNEQEAALDLLDKTLGMNLAVADTETLILEKAEIKAGQGKPEEAGQLCDLVLKKNQGNIDAHYLMGRIFFKQQEMEKAEIHLNQVAASRPEDGLALILLARSQMLGHKDVLAEDTLQNALKVKPSQLAVRLELVRYFMKSKDYKRAMGFIDEGIKFHPGNVTLLGYRGGIDVLRKNFAKAEKDYMQIISLDPDSSKGYLGMGRLSLARQDSDKAVKWFMQAKDKENGLREAMSDLIRIHLAQKNYLQAFELVEGEIKKRPDVAGLHYYKGVIHVGENDFAQGEQAMQKAIALAPEWSLPYSKLAEIYIKQDRLPGAIAELEKGYGKSGKKAIGLQLTALYDHNGQYDAAEKIYMEMLDQDKDSLVLLNNLAFLYADKFQDKERLHKAEAMVNRVLAIHPDKTGYLDTAAWVAFRQGNLDRAWFHMQKTLEGSPDVGVYNLHASIIAHKRGQRETALNYLDEAMNLPMDLRTHKQALALRKELGG